MTCRGFDPRSCAACGTLAAFNTQLGPKTTPRKQKQKIVTEDGWASRVDVLPWGTFLSLRWKRFHVYGN